MEDGLVEVGKGQRRRGWNTGERAIPMYSEVRSTSMEVVWEEGL
jgi:hypothetical protein